MHLLDDESLDGTGVQDLQGVDFTELEREAVTANDGDCWL
jgi:hypothetical protein